MSQYSFSLLINLCSSFKYLQTEQDHLQIVAYKLYTYLDQYHGYQMNENSANHLEIGKTAKMTEYSPVLLMLDNLNQMVLTDQGSPSVMQHIVSVESSSLLLHSYS